MNLTVRSLCLSVPFRAMREIAFINRESQSLRVNLTDILKDMSKMDEHSK